MRTGERFFPPGEEALWKGKRFIVQGEGQRRAPAKDGKMITKEE